MWTKDAIKRWMESMDAPSGEYLPDEEVAKSIPGVRLPGELCYICTKKRVDMLDTMRPMYESIFEKYEQFGGKRTGIVVGLIPCGSNSATYFDIPALAKRPIKILFSRIYPTGAEVFSSGFNYPTQAKLSVPT